MTVPRQQSEGNLQQGSEGDQSEALHATHPAGVCRPWLYQLLSSTLTVYDDLLSLRSAIFPPPHTPTSHDNVPNEQEQPPPPHVYELPNHRGNSHGYHFLEPRHKPHPQQAKDHTHHAQKPHLPLVGGRGKKKQQVNLEGAKLRPHPPAGRIQSTYSVIMCCPEGTSPEDACAPVAQTAAAAVDPLEDMVFTLETKQGDLFGAPAATGNGHGEWGVGAEEAIYDLPPEETTWCRSGGYCPDDDVIYDVPDP